MKDKAMLVIIFTLLAILFFALGLFYIANGLSRGWLIAWAVMATMCLPALFVAGFWFGKTEVRGFLGGADAALDKIARAVDMRDGSKINTHQALARPAPQPYTPPQVELPDIQDFPRITHRASDKQTIIDM